ncbi:uncharacterized protein LOC127245639 [Andrographis paniculata]|uniref:uncharacterized protein LOC127245639 n=1 Tax=Andrographis paniculata TaxID=175694 RepID=UPI0021E994BE|nr:uncharacterized protein LOC127245639 [Andrographis paniculata]
MKMLCSDRPPLIQLLLCIFSIGSMRLSVAYNSESTEMKGRSLMGIKETPEGGNVTFDCTPSGPCIPCSHAEKSDEKYHCGETGYRIRLKCLPTRSTSKDEKSKKPEKTRSTLERYLGVSSTNRRRLVTDSSKSGGGSTAYVTYRSCIPAVNEERLSVLGFEALMLALLLGSGSFIYLRRKRSSLAAGGVPMRIPTSSRF